MDAFGDFDRFDELEAFDNLPGVKNMARKTQRQARKLRADGKPKAAPAPVQVELAAMDDGLKSLQFTYQAARHENIWLRESLESFYEQDWILDVLRIVKGGKEANVYQAAGHPNLVDGYVAAKVYRPRSVRNLKNDYLYREGRSNLDIDGRVIRDDRMERAMRKKTQYGKELLHTSWIGHEFHTLQILYAAGVDVPKPYATGSNAILMGYVGSETTSAPALNEVDLDRAEAQALFERVLWNLETMLAYNRVHGDLSAYNILYWEGEIKLIDFPQAIEPEANRSAFRIFERDVTRVCQYFAAQGVPSQPRRLAASLWSAYHHPLAPEVDPAFLDSDDEQDRELWRRQSEV